VDLFGSFMPMPGMSFALLTCANLYGSFTVTELPVRLRPLHPANASNFTLAVTYCCIQARSASKGRPCKGAAGLAHSCHRLGNPQSHSLQGRASPASVASTSVAITNPAAFHGIARGNSHPASSETTRA
jgi:hypothetical protein